MNITNPYALIGLLLIPVIIYLHMIRRKRKVFIVPSLLLWNKIQKNLPSPFRRRIKENINLLLQILTLMFLIIALSGPITAGGRPSRGGTLVLILDGGAGMGAQEENSTRFDEAKALARKAVRENRGGETALIMAAGEPAIIHPLSGDTKSILESLRNLKNSHEQASIKEALGMADSLISGKSRARIILITDGAFTLSAEAGELISKLPLQVSFISSENTDNLGITEFKVREHPTLPGRRELLVKAANFYREARDTELILSLEGKEIVRVPLTLPSSEEESLFIPLPGLKGRLEGRLETSDSFPTDDAAYIYLGEPSPVSILLVTEGNLYLETLFSLIPGASVEVSPSYFHFRGQDLVVFDSFTPPFLPPGRYIFFGGLPPLPGISETGTAEFPQSDSWLGEHPFLSSLDPSSFFILKALYTETLPGSGFTPVLGAEPPLLYSYEKDGTKAAVFTFALSQSSLPLRPAFPLLITNILNWLYPDFSLDTSYSALTGKPISLPSRMSDPEMPLQIAGPEGFTQTITPRNQGGAFIPPRPGFYTLTGRDKSGQETQQVYAANLLSSDESNLFKRFSPPPRGRTDTEGFSGASSALWKVLLLLGLALLLLEIIPAKGYKEIFSGRKLYRKLPAAGAVILLITALLNPKLVGRSDQLNLLFLLDTSESISLRQRDQAFKWINETVSGKKEGDTAALILFGANPKTEIPPSHDFGIASLRSLPPGGSTDLASAYRQAMALMPEGGENRIILLSDGNETRGDLIQNLESAGDAGVPVFTVPLHESADFKEVTALSITGPQKTALGEPFTLTLEIDSREPVYSVVSFYRNGLYLGEDRVELRSGRTIISYDTLINEPGYHLFEVYIDPEEDGNRENNLFRRVVFAEAEPPILYIHGEGETSPAFLSALSAQGYSVRSLKSADFPDTLRELYSYKAVILDNIPAYDLSLAKMDLLRQGVAGGLGLLLLGGDSSFGAGGYYKTPLEKALPVDMDITSSVDMPSLCLLMLIDKSGSMGDLVEGGLEKMDLAKQALYSAAEVLTPNHNIGIIAFDSRPNWVVPIIQSSDLSSLSAGLSSLTAGGGTILYPALEESYKALSAASAAVKHLIILSDGLTEEGEFETLARQMYSEGITISTVAVGADADRNLMESIALWGRGRSYYTEDIHNVPALFASESLKVSRKLMVEETFIPEIAALHEILQGLYQEDIPPLHGFLLSYTKPQAEQLLSGPEGNPLLSVWQYGLGRSAAFTSNLFSSWAADWVVWEQFPVLFSQILRWIGRGSPDPDISLSLLRSGGRTEILVNALDYDKGFINGLKLEAVIIGPDLRETTLPIPQTAPGRYEAAFPTEQEGIYFVSLAGALREARPSLLASGVMTIPYPEEFVYSIRGREILADAAAVTGGKILSVQSVPPREEFNPARTGNKIPLGKTLLLFGVLLYFLGLLFRYISPLALFMPFFKLFSAVFYKFKRKDSLTFEQLKAIIEKGKAEEEERKPDLSFWFGREQQEEESLRLYVAKLRKKEKT